MLLIICINLMNKNVVFDEFNNNVVLHTSEDFVKMRKAGSLASKVLDILNRMLRGCNYKLSRQDMSRIYYFSKCYSCTLKL